ncbi:MAG: tetratricopeptide repeat protein, partial [Planctomycetota bacterium]|jgi:cytochrome c-type biogenesis protein CcmH/NrfG
MHAFASRLFEVQPTNLLSFRILMERDPASLLARLERAVQENPDRPENWACWAMAQMATGQSHLAFDAFHKAVQLEPDNPEFLQGLIETDPYRAVELLQGLAQSDPNNEELIGKLGRALADTGRKQEAFAVLMNALEREPEDPEWLDMLLGIDPSRTCKTLNTWVQENPENDMLHGILGRARMASGDPQGAYSAYAEAFKTQPIPVWAHGMAEADSARAITALTAHLDLTPERFTAIQTHLATASTGPPGTWSALPGVHPRHYNLLGELGLAMVNRDRLAEGAPIIEHVLRSPYAEARQASSLIGALGRADPSRGVRFLRDLAASAGHDDEVWGRIGDGYREMGMIPEARTAYRRARSLDPTDEEWITALWELDR